MARLPPESVSMRIRHIAKRRSIDPVSTGQHCGNATDDSIALPHDCDLSQIRSTVRKDHLYRINDLIEGAGIDPPGLQSCILEGRAFIESPVCDPGGFVISDYRA